ncbi:hypothetical protein H4R99_000649 [Coemansia sp. RSA 1722]|nr:hypothetical protein LPJ57_001801 [Coemansia sp. RSA 486]KAJ2237927.1 hypothetical protein IWW45_000532 [Coemansia sp. RSA 485]KAJ2606096.1 hypothetical protein H4R99_000649 [Coemansia sp. RSA 1722]
MNPPPLLCNPARWPPEITDRLVVFIAQEQSSEIESTQCAQTQTLSSILKVCHTWRNSARHHLSQHLCLTTNRCLSRQHQPRMAAPHTAKLKTSLAGIVSGDFLSTHLHPTTVYPRVATLCIDIASPGPKDLAQPVADDTEIQHNTIHVYKYLMGLFPNISKLCFEAYPQRSSLWTLLTSSLYSRLALHVQRHNHRRMVPGNTSTFVSHGTSLSSHHSPVVLGGLAAITIGMVTLSEDGVIEVVHRNASTLRSLSIRYSRSPQALGLVETNDGQPVIYPQLQSLAFGIYTGVAIPNRNTCWFQPFPKLQSISIPGVYPFANTVLLDNARKSYKSVSLAVSSHLLDSFKDTEFFNIGNAFVGLQHLDVHALPVDDPFLFAGTLVDDGLQPRNVSTCVDLVLGASADGVPSIRLDLGNALDIGDFIRRVEQTAESHTKMRTLDLGSTRLNLRQAKALLSALPGLSTLKYTASETLDDEQAWVTSKVSVSEITVDMECTGVPNYIRARYLASLGADLTLLMRINVVGQTNHGDELLDTYNDYINEESEFFRTPQTDHLHACSLVKYRKRLIDADYLYADLLI